MKLTKGQRFGWYLVGIAIVSIMNLIMALVVSTVLYFVSDYESFAQAVIHGVTVWLIIMGIDSLLKSGIKSVNDVEDRL